MNETRPTRDETRESPMPEVRTMFRDADEAAIRDIEERYGDLIPQKRLTEMREHPVNTEAPVEFSDVFERRFGMRPGEGTLGWTVSAKESAHVSTGDLGSVPEAIYHERIHQAAAPEVASAVPADLNEGITQALTERATGQTHEGEEKAPYPEETSRAKKMAEAAGWDVIECAYFKGDAGEFPRQIPPEERS